MDLIKKHQFIPKGDSWRCIHCGKIIQAKQIDLYSMYRNQARCTQSPVSATHQEHFLGSYNCLKDDAR